MKMKKWLSLLLSGAMALSLLSGVSLAAQEPAADAAPVAAAAAAFPDVEGNWAAASIERWATAGIVHGDGLGNYNPGNPMTRAEFATVLNNLMGYTAKAENTFADVQDTDWYADAVLKLAAAGVMQGDGVNADPQSPITRQEAFVMLCRALKIAPKESANTSFADDASIASWAKGAVAVLAEMGIASGVGGNSFAPLVNIDRASMAALLDKSIKVYANKDGQEITGKVDGIVILAAKNVTFRDAGVTGTILLAPAMGADATVTLTGSSEVGSLNVDVEGLSVVVESGAKLADVTLAAKGTALMVKGTAVKVTAQAADTMVTVAKGGKITTLVANSAVKVQNDGSIGTLEVNADGVIVDGSKPSRVKVADGVKVPTDSKGNAITRGTGAVTGGGGSSYYQSITDVYILVNDTHVYTLVGDSKVVNVNVDDVLTAKVTPASAAYTTSWLVGGTEKGTGSSYTVSALDLGQSIQVKVTGTGGYSGSRTSDPTAPVTAAATGGDIYNITPDVSPVALTDRENTHFVDGDGQVVEIPTDATLTLSVTKSENAAPSTADSGRIDVGIVAQVKDADGNVVSGVTPPGDTATVAVDVDLTMKTTVGEETTETAVHPVGETVVTLTRENLGLPANADLNMYVFAASHVNAIGETQSVEGTVVKFNGQDCVRFTLNGLSRIWIGNVPPRTVTFDTDGDTAIESQKVKFGSFAIRPTKNPVKEGWIFTGWDHDLETENIIKDITVKAQWTKGSPAADAQLTGAWTVDGQALGAGETAPAEAEMANGEVIITLDSKAVYPANIAYTLTVAAPQGAVNAYVDTTAEGAAASTTAASAPVTLKADVTDADGAVQLSNQIIYVKWTDTDGDLVDLQSARLVVKTELNAPADVDTKTRTETLDVNRGIGTFEFFLTGGKNAAGEAIEDYVGSINGYLNWNGEQYALDLCASFADTYYITNAAASTGSSEERIRSTNYTTLKAVATPFEGQSFSAVPTVEGWYWDYSGEKSERKTWGVTAALQEGKLVLTCPILQGEDVSDLMMDISMEGDKTQQLEFWFGSWTGDDAEESNYGYFETWEETLAAIAAHEYDRVHYTGDADVTLTTPITLNVDQDLYIQNASLTIGAGGSITMKGTYGDAAYLWIKNGYLTIAEGGKLLVPAQPEDISSHRVTSVNAQTGVTVAEGGVIEVERNGYLHVGTQRGGFVVEEGGALNSAGVFYCYRNDSYNGKNIIAGTVTASGRVEFDDGLTVAATGHIDVNSSYYEALRVYGGLTVEEGGGVDFTGTYQRNNAYDGILSGRTVNAGTINVKAGTLFMANTAFSTANMGTITVAADAELDTNGTVLVNTGSITGAGTILTGEYEDVTDYDDHNGLEWVEIEAGTGSTPVNHSRYVFTSDPAETVEAIYYLGEVSNQDGGTCTLTLAE